jgi:rfaE bifunctional protein kinase chain/domain
MQETWLQLLRRWQGMKVLVIGEVMLDVFVRGQVSRINREALVPILQVAEVEEMPGGAANAAVNAAVLGARVRLVSISGNDVSAKRLMELLRGFGVETKGIIQLPTRKTLEKRRVMTHQHMLVRYDSGSEETIRSQEEKSLKKRN